MNHTFLYSPAAEHHHCLAGTHCAYPWRDGQTKLIWVTGYGYIMYTFSHICVYQVSNFGQCCAVIFYDAGVK